MRRLRIRTGSFAVWSDRFACSRSTRRRRDRQPPATQVQVQPGTVVAYDALIDVQNADAALRPGMTAIISLDDHTL
jgi:hypothetical protein